FPQNNIQANIAEDQFVLGDRLLLQLLVNNLIDNAIKYSPKEAAIRIELSGGQHRLSLRVKDEGKGISDEEKKKIFNKYYRVGNAATRAAKGTGLGLYLSKKIARQHNANISVTDNAPTGSIFTVELPAYSEKR
ncbi:MAG TPA: sensor histidine kinase, partial [Ferruginibacter sp.]|nr:sensor histidine kinase [Ferruginibacter sp.]